MRTRLVWVLSLGMMGCAATDDETEPSPDTGDAPSAVDADGDGTLAAEDCNDADPALNRVDADADGVSTCDGDCDDEDAAAYPGAAAQEPALCAADRDGDGYGDASAVAPLEPGTDCDDGDAAAYPGAEEVWYDGVDQDCAGGSDFDADADGYDSDLHGGTDCDDTNPAAYPGADESLLGGDLDCDGVLTNQMADADYQFVADEMMALGYQVSSAGDVDGDGLADILVSALYADLGGENTGAVYLMFGKSLGSGGTINIEDADYVFFGEEPDDQAGCSIVGVGDVDGDGLDDLLIGANYYGSGVDDLGRAYLVLGGSLGAPGEVDLADADYVFMAETRLDETARSVAGPGDVDGDGLADLLIGAGTNSEGGTAAGKAYVILASSLGDTREINLADADYGFIGQSRTYTGSYVAGAGDVDDDGLGDFLVTAVHSDDYGTSSGRVHLILGSSLGSSRTIRYTESDYTFYGPSASYFAGAGLMGSAGDVDGDGLGDLVFGAYGGNGGGNGSGHVHLVLGASLGAEPSILLRDTDYTFIGEASLDRVNHTRGIGDIDGDGLDDIAMGAYGNDDGGDMAGKVYIILGSSLGDETEIGLSEADYGLLGDAGQRLGSSLAGAGDVNGDGLDDVLFGSSSANEAYLLLGR